MVGELLCADPVCRTIAGIPTSVLRSRLRIVVQPAGTPMGQDPFVAAFHPDLAAALVVLTTDNAFVTLPLESNATLRATAALWELNGALARDTPRALPARLLWVRGWTVHDLGAGVADGKFSFDLPQDLRAVLAALP